MLIIVAVAAVIIAVALLLWLRRLGAIEPPREGATGPPTPVSPPTGAAAPGGVEPKAATPVAEAGAPSVPAAEGREEAAVGMGAAEVEPVRHVPSEREIREQVRTQLQESERMLSELKDEAVEELSQSAGSVEVMEEGLQEVRALAERKQWNQAKNKGEALHAQLSLLIQSARREKAS